MEPTILPQQKTVKRSYKHYSINSQAVAAPVKKLEFFYLGRKSGVIDVLIDAFESGYAAENIENAKSMLRRLADQSGIFPDVIIADASLGYACAANCCCRCSAGACAVAANLPATPSAIARRS